MSQSARLLPAITTREEYEALQPDKLLWPRAVVAICRRQLLAIDNLKRFGDGTNPADGSAVVFAIGKEYVLKLFPLSTGRHMMLSTLFLSSLLAS